MSNAVMIDGLKEIYNDYDTYILDQWGVMHDGRNGYKKAVHCVEKLFLKNKNLIIISNSSKRKNSTINRLPTLGFKSENFKEVMTSGEMIWQSLFNENYNQTKDIGKNCFHIFDKSKEDGSYFLKGLEKFKSVRNIEESNFILGCTPFENSNVLDYTPILDKALKYDIPFICANPDFETIETSKTKKNIFCMGTIAELYNNMGGKTFLLGKPIVDIYLESTKKIEKIKKSKILAIGDSLYHDIKGAQNFGIDSLLITSTGIHNNIFEKENPNWQSKYNTLQNIGITPTFISSEFKF